MTTLLSAKALLGQVLSAIEQSGWRVLVLESQKPFRLRVFRTDEKWFDLCIYLWNCTHGGGAARSRDEYRVQITGVVPEISVGAAVLLLGWHADYGVFVGFDIRRHSGQASQSPSIQIKEETLRGAHVHAFAIHQRQNGENAVAFRPEFLVDYAMNSASLHSTGKAAADLSLLNGLDSLTDADIEAITSKQRRIVLSQIARKYRATDFRKRVLGAYEHRCAACGVQLELLDAAHIIPVVANGSTDETKNGIALCKLHHAAFDRNLLSFDESYKIEVSGAQESRLRSLNLLGGIVEFKQQLRTVILLPSDRRDYPPPSYISKARKLRMWTA